jgi:hypothetical protein
MKTLMPALVLCAALAACSQNGTPGASSTAPTTPPPATIVPTPTPTSKPKPSATALPTDLKDGRTYAYVKALDPAKATVTIDVVQFLTGEAAQKAAQEDGKEAFDFYVRNQQTRLRTLTFSTEASIVTNTLTAGKTGSSSKDTTITLAEFQQYFAKGESQRRLFYLTLKQGVVVAFHEQYLP